MLRGVEIQRFREALLEHGIKDEGVHHEFTSGVHGEKLDFEVIKRGTDLWRRWVEMNAAYIRQIFPEQRPPALLSIANGTCELTNDVALELNKHGNYRGIVMAGHTQKERLDNGGKMVTIREDTWDELAYWRPESVIEIDDAATSGSTTAMPVVPLWNQGIHDVRALYTWLRGPQLSHLDQLGVQYYGIVDNYYLPNYLPEDCERSGLCAEGVTLVPYGETLAPVDRIEVL